MGLVYGYLTGPRFRQRIKALVEKVSDMQDDLPGNVRPLSGFGLSVRHRSRASSSTVGMYGDLQGIGGKVMHEIESLQILGVEGPLEND
ncbi:hypothetical protein [Mesorhizobium australicum]